MNWPKCSVLVTGGNGFLGINLVQRLIEIGISKIRVIDNLDRQKNLNMYNKDKGVKFINRNLGKLPIIFSEFSFPLTIYKKLYRKYLL